MMTPGQLEYDLARDYPEWMVADDSDMRPMVWQ